MDLSKVNIGQNAPYDVNVVIEVPLGGRMVARSSEKFGPKSLDKVAFAWTN